LNRRFETVVPKRRVALFLEPNFDFENDEIKKSNLFILKSCWNESLSPFTLGKDWD
jgi:hypothetical protein